MSQNQHESTQDTHETARQFAKLNAADRPTIEIRAAIDGKTVIFLAQIETNGRWGPSMAGQFQMILTLLCSMDARHVDARIDNQKKSIDRLVDHVRAHHNELGIGSAEDCLFVREGGV